MRSSRLPIIMLALASVMLLVLTFRQPNRTVSHSELRAAGVVAIHEGDFQQVALQSDKPVVVEFGATWCGPCRRLEPVLADIAAEYGDRITVAQVDVDQSPRLTSEHRVSGFPTLIFFAGGEATHRIQGFTPGIANAIRSRLDRMLAEG